MAKTTRMVQHEMLQVNDIHNVFFVLYCDADSIV